MRHVEYVTAVSLVEDAVIARRRSRRGNLVEHATAVSLVAEGTTRTSRLTDIPVLVYSTMVRILLSMSREKPLHWVASAKKDYLAFPSEVQDEMGYALGLAQLGAKHPKAKPWKGEGPGIFEIVEDHRGSKRLLPP